MSVQVKRRREAAAFLAGFTGAQGELIVDTTNNRVQVHDGATAGGFPAAKLAEVLQIANNLSDLPNKPVALSNLGAVASTLIGTANGIASLDGTGHVPLAQLPAAIVGALQFQGTWNAASNTPVLVPGTGTKGYFYKVSTAGTTPVDGNSQWNAGDMIVFDGTVWDKIDGASPGVISVAGLTGTVSAAQILGAIEANTGTSGTGALVFSASPVLVTPNLGTPSSLNLANATGLSSTALPAFTGDVTSPAGSSVNMLATVNSAPGSSGSSTAIPVITTNGKGLVTAQTTAAVVAPAGTLTGNTLAANVTASSLTSVGSLTAGTIPASLLSGTTGAAQEPAHTGDVTNTAGSLALNVVAIGGVAPGPAATALAGQIPGTATSDNANAGNIGEYLSVQLSPASAISLTSGSAANVTSITLTPGDWDVWCQFYFVAATGATVTQTTGANSGSSALILTSPTQPTNTYPITYTGNGTPLLSFSTGVRRVPVSSSTPFYAVAQCNFSGGTCSVYGSIEARRAR